MGLGRLRGEMWAGVMDDHIATDDKSVDEYTPLTVALFKTKADAEQHYERVVRVDVDKMFRIEPKKI